MSTDYRFLSQRVLADQLFDGRLERFGIREHVNTNTSSTRRCLTDNRNYLWVHIKDDAEISSITRHAGNTSSKILSAIAETFDVEIVSEHDPRFWGFETQEEWDAAMKAFSREAEEGFYGELANYVKGLANDIQPDTVGMVKAKIAERLVEQDPSMLAPEKKSNFMEAIEIAYESEHAVIIPF
jgi:hypothetical protein